MSIARLIHGITSQYSPKASPELKAIGAIAPELGVLLGTNTKINKWALVGISGALAAAPLASRIGNDNTDESSPTAEKQKLENKS